MKRIATFVTATCAACAPAAELAAPEFGFATNRVEAGSVQVQADCILAADGSCIHKSGGGEWSVPLSYLPQHWPVSFAVQEGTLSFGTGGNAGGYASPADLPEAIKAKALIWVDAADSAKIVETDGAVAKWHDRRETGTAQRLYPAAETTFEFTNRSPVLVETAAGAKAVYFGGLASGQSMKFVNPDGTGCDRHSGVENAVKHVFAVMDVSNSYGNVFGAYGNSLRSPFRIGNDSSPSKSLTGHYFYSGGEGNQSALNEMMIHGRAYRDGVRMDPTQTSVDKGLQLIEAEARILTADTLVSGLFAGPGVKYSGGDYLCEAIAFTNRLTGAERLAVTEYLMSKWMPGKGRHLKKVALASGTKLSMDVGEGAVAGTRISLSGQGGAEKTGGGELRVSNITSDEGVEWNVKEGSLTLCAFAPVKVAAGMRVTVDNPATGPLVGTAPATTPDSFVKGGKERLAVNGVPAGAKRISVEGGTLTVRAPRIDEVAPESAYEVPVPNGSFEDYAQILAEKYADGSRVGTLGDMTGHGWRKAEGTAYVYDYDGWNTGSGGIIANTRTAFNFYARPPDGKCVLMMRSINNNPTTVRSEPIALPEDGDYELALKMSGRNSSSYVGGNLRVRMVGAEDSTVHGPEHRVRYTYLDGYVEHRFRFPAMKAGSRRIEFYVAANSFCIQVDDVRLFKVPAEPLSACRWKVPGGDFETKGNMVGRDAIRTFSTGNTHADWTFAQPDSWNKSLPAVGLTTLAVTNAHNSRRGLLYNNSREPYGGSFQLCMLGNGASAQTSVRPPAGTYRLESFVSRFGSYGVYPKVDASAVKADGTEIALGRLEPVNKMMSRHGWPGSFTVDGNETVTLRFSAVGLPDRVDHLASGVLIDDVELVTATDLELFAHGECSGANGDYRLKAINATEFGGLGGKVQTRSDTENPGVFGGEMIDGHKMIVIGNISCIYEDVALPFAGRYRLSFYTHSRTSKTGIYGPNPLEVRLIDGVRTNVLGRVDTYSTDWVQRIYEFRVPAAGTYRVELKGLTNPTAANAQYEAHVDSISLRQAHGERDVAAPFGRETCIDVAEGARLETDFSGTNVIRRMKLGGVAVGGVVDVSDHPEYLSGTGVFRIVPHGSMMVFR